MNHFNPNKSPWKRLLSVPQRLKKRASRERVFRRKLRLWCKERDVLYGHDLEQNVLKLSSLVEAFRKRLAANAVGGFTDADLNEYAPSVKKLRLRPQQTAKSKREKHRATMKPYPTGRNADWRQAAAFELMANLESFKKGPIVVARPTGQDEPGGPDFHVLKAALDYLFYFLPPVNSRTVENWIRKHRQGVIPPYQYFRRFDFQCIDGHRFFLWSDEARCCPVCGSEYLKKL